MKYQVNDKSLENEKINGVMKLCANNGTLIHTSSFPDGFTYSEQIRGAENFCVFFYFFQLKFVESC